MIKIDAIRDDLKSISEKLSDLTKTISLSALAMSWLLLIGGKDSPVLPQPADKFLLMIVGCVSLLSLVAGYLQYIFAYASSKAVHDIAERDGKTVTEYDPESVLYKMRTWMFWTKQVLAGLAVMLLLAVLMMAMF
jgi:hypothetical protein